MSDILKQTSFFVQNDFELSEFEKEPSEEELKALLADRIAYLLEKRFEYLMNIFYRLDVDEHKVSWALSPASPESPALALAALVFQRQKQRAATFIEYANKSKDSEKDFFS